MLEQLTASVDEALGIAPDTLDDGELHEAVVGLLRQCSRLAAARARLIGAWEARQIWSDDGSRSPASRLSRDCGLALATARGEVCRARKLRSMPHTADGLAEGSLSVDHADMLARANRREAANLFARDEATLVDQATTLRFAHFERAVRYWSQCADDTRAEADAETQRAARRLHTAKASDGNVFFQGRLDPLGGAAFLDELEQLESELFESDWAAAKAIHGEHTTTTHLKRTPAQRRADALVEMAHRSRTLPANGKRPRPLITVLCGYETFAGRLCELVNGTIVTPGQLLPLVTDADIERIVFDGPSRVIDVGERRRLFTGALRRAIEIRDRHCTHPCGCDVYAPDCEVDHVVEYSKGGLTTQANGRLRCDPHNRNREDTAKQSHKRAPPRGTGNPPSRDGRVADPPQPPPPNDPPTTDHRTGDTEQRRSPPDDRVA